MNTNDKGNLGLAMVIADVMKRGYFVFTPIADTTSVDIIIANPEMSLRRVQIKYRKKNDKGTLEVPTNTVVNGKKIPVILSKIDLWAIYCPDTDKVYYIPTKILEGKSYMFLRIDKPVKKDSKIFFADEFIELNF